MNGEIAKRAPVNTESRNRGVKSMKKSQVQAAAFTPVPNCDIDDVFATQGRRTMPKRHIPVEFIPRLMRPDKFKMMEDAKIRAGEERRRQRQANAEEIKSNQINNMQKNFKSRETVKKVPIVGQRSSTALDIPKQHEIVEKLAKVQKFHIQPAPRQKQTFEIKPVPTFH